MDMTLQCARSHLHDAGKWHVLTFFFNVANTIKSTGVQLNTLSSSEAESCVHTARSKPTESPSVKKVYGQVGQMNAMQFM